MNEDDWLTQHIESLVEALFEAQEEQLRQELTMFVAMGYEPKELTLVLLSDGRMEFAPKSSTTIEAPDD
jgi:hypothetical protein